MLSGRMRRRLTTAPACVQPHEAAAVLAQIDPENRDLHRMSLFLQLPAAAYAAGVRGGPSHKLRTRFDVFPLGGSENDPRPLQQPLHGVKSACHRGFVLPAPSRAQPAPGRNRSLPRGWPSTFSQGRRRGRSGSPEVYPLERRSVPTVYDGHADCGAEHTSPVFICHMVNPMR